MYKPVYTDAKKVYNRASRATPYPGREKNESFDENKNYRVGGKESNKSATAQDRTYGREPGSTLFWPSAILSIREEAPVIRRQGKAREGSI